MKRLIKTTLLLLAFSAYFSSCAEFFQTKIPMDTSSAEANLYDLLNPKNEEITLQPPEQVFASQGLYSGTILVSWKACENATSYRLERAIVTPDANGNYRVPEESDFNILKSHYYKTVYTDTILSNPSSSNDEYKYRYYYRISSENISKNLDASEFSDWTKEETEGMGYLFAAPANVEATKGSSSTSITLKWNKVEGATYYKIYRDTRSDFTSAAYIDSVRGNVLSYSNAINTIDQGTEFYYKITAQNSSNQESAKSTIAMGYALQAGAPSAPETIQVIDGYGTSKSELKIKWSEATNTSANGGTLTYSLYRTSSVDSVYTLIKNNIPEGTTTHTDTVALKPGIYYYYYIQTVITEDDETLKSSFTNSGAGSDNPAMGFLLSPSSNLEIADSENEGKVYVIWSPAIGSELEGTNFLYNIYYSDYEAGPYSIVENGEAISGRDYSLIDSNYSGYLYAELDKKNYYKITTLNQTGIDTESNHSSAAAPLPDAPNNVEASKTALLPDNYFTPNENGVYPVLIKWQKPENDNPTGYYIYRSTKPTSAFRKITDEVITTRDSNGNFYFYDVNETAKVGTFYYYKIISLNSLNQGKKGNNPAEDTERKSWGYGAITRDRWFVAYNPEVFSSQAKLTLMHKPGSTDKLGSETIKADIAVNGTLGTLSYNAKIQGLGARIIMLYTNYADHYIGNDENLGIYFLVNGNTNTTASMDSSGQMDGTVTCTHSFKNGVFIGMYPGEVKYDGVQIKGGAAGGGYYTVTTKDLNGNTVLTASNISWLFGEEGK